MNTKLAGAGSAVWGFSKTIFPGLIVSIIGGSFAFLVFNNPDKIRGKATLRAWESLKQYERLYTNNTDIINCGNIAEGAVRFKSNMLHQIQMTSENLKNILEKEGNVDNLMLAIINMKIDSYNEMKKRSEAFLDTLISIDTISVYKVDKEEFTKRWIKTYTSYMDECGYIKNRDTATINKIVKELSKIYSIDFLQEKNIPDLKELRKSLIGDWNISLFQVSFGLKEDSTGYWNGWDLTSKCTWQLDSTILKIKLDGDSESMKFSLERVTPGNILFNQLGGDFANNSFLACRSK